MSDISIKRTITINGVTYDDMDAIPADVREQYAPLLKMMSTDEDGNGIPDIMDRNMAKAGRGEPVTERLVEVRIDHNGPGEVANPEAWGMPEVTKTRRVKFSKIAPEAPQDSGVVQRHGEGGTKRNVLIVVLFIFVFAFFHLYFKK